jgi:hypothetical protein
LFGSPSNVVPSQQSMELVSNLARQLSKEGISLLVYVRSDGVGVTDHEIFLIQSLQALFPKVPVLCINNKMNGDQVSNDRKVKAMRISEVTSIIPGSNYYSVSTYPSREKILDDIVCLSNQEYTFTEDRTQKNIYNAISIIFTFAKSYCNLITDSISRQTCFVMCSIIAEFLKDKDN